MQVLNVTNLPIYLPYDHAPQPFGDPLEGVTATAAAPGVITIPGYNNPQANDAIVFTFLSGGSMPAPLVYGTTYYVVTPSGNTVTVSATKGGGAITTTTTGASLVAHLVSGEVDGVTLPFKPTGTVVVENNSGGTLVLQGAPDLNAGVGPPQGPGTWVTLLSLVTGGQGIAQLTYDWIRVSTSGTLTLQQN